MIARVTSEGFHRRQSLRVRAAFGLLFSELVLLGANTLWRSSCPSSWQGQTKAPGILEANGKTCVRDSAENKLQLTSAPKGHSVCSAEGSQEWRQREQVEGYWDGGGLNNVHSWDLDMFTKESAGFTDDPIVECGRKQFRRFWIWA